MKKVNVCGQPQSLAENSGICFKAVILAVGWRIDFRLDRSKGRETC